MAHHATSWLFLFRPSSFVRVRGKSRQILEWKNRNGAVRDTEGFIIGSRCTGHDIKLSYAYLGIFYYHQEQRNTLFPPEIRYGARLSPSFLLVLSRSSQRFRCQVTLTCLYLWLKVRCFSSFLFYFHVQYGKNRDWEEKSEERSESAPVPRFLESLA